MVAVNCLVNYWFFIGEAVFVILYVAVRISCGGWNCSFGKFCAIAFESVLGVLIAAVGLLPSVLALMGNPRTGWDTLLTGWNMWIYGWNQRLPAILQSFFFPPELPSRPNFSRIWAQNGPLCPHGFRSFPPSGQSPTAG